MLTQKGESVCFGQRISRSRAKLIIAGSLIEYTLIPNFATLSKKSTEYDFTVTLRPFHAYFLFGGLYAPREYGTLPLLSVERLVIVR